MKKDTPVHRQRSLKQSKVGTATMKSEINGSPPVLGQDNSTTKLPTSPKNSAPKTGFSKNRNQEKNCKDEQEEDSGTVWELQDGKISDGDGDGGDIIRVSRRRWLVLIVFLVYALVGTFQWSMYAIISNIITKYYNVSNLSVDFTTLVFLISFTVAFLPASWILNNLGLRWAMLMSCFLNALGCFLRILSVERDRFWLTMFAQLIVGLSQVAAPIIPTRLAAVWFPAHQVSFACAFAYNGILAGNAVGFVAPPILVRNSENLVDIAKDLDRLYIGLAASSFFSFLLTVAFFQEKPPLPPSQAQRLQENEPKRTESLKEFFRSLKRLVTKRTFVTLLISFALIGGVFCAIATLLNQVLIPHFPGREKEVGIAGLILILSGIVSSAICGYILDCTQAFKMTTVALYLLTLAGWIAFSIVLRFGNMAWIYVAIAMLGLVSLSTYRFATSGVQPVCLEFGVEITFPESEATASGLMCAAFQLCGVLCTLLYGYMLLYWGDNLANALMTIPIVIGFCVSIFIRPRLKRQAAQRRKNLTEDMGY